MDASDDALIAQASAWAAKRKRPLDPGLLSTALEMRAVYDERSAGSWPEGSAHDLVLVRWPAHGPAGVPDPDELAGTLESFWRFLRGTGRMTMASAEPAALVRELRRALPRMADVCADRSKWSQGRVLGEFGTSIGIDLGVSESIEDAQAKLDTITARWNALPVAERQRLMPDPSPKSAKGMAITDLFGAMRAGACDERDDPWGFEPVDERIGEELGDGPGERFGGFAGFGESRGDPVAAARQARDSPFVTACLELAGWVGPRRQVTSIGVLRPAVAREAYRDLGLHTWEAAHGPRSPGHREDDRTSQMMPALPAQSAVDSFSSAADCRPLHRLWHAGVVAWLIDVRATVASGTVPEPATDPEWLHLAVLLLVGLSGTLSRSAVDALVVTLELLVEAPDGEAALAAVHERWLEVGGHARGLAAHADRDHAVAFRDAYLYPVEEALAAFDDSGVWTRREGWLAVTDFGREVAWVFGTLSRKGALQHRFGQ